ncbi:DUF2255 family protein [Streptomyces sp. NPDC051001]|uniref:DUF2255 family protein n=1 Tax=Streptomyces sp. NPDC051001 TaxID=3155795 RepID=UPI00343FC41F
MRSWSQTELRSIAENADLFVSPFRENGIAYGTPTQTWALVVDSNVQVRAANGQQPKWHQAAASQEAGRVRVAGTSYEVTFEPVDSGVDTAVDAAYEKKYRGSQVGPIMQGDGPKSAPVRISLR